ncbi:MAG: restriction endonuclease subunit S [Ardenticatenaceae bacterium]|nr:restriction endonuclease subunit S [Ardenticatenaceae bacterium]
MSEKLQKVKLVDICRPKQWKTISMKNLHDDGYPVYGANGKVGFYSEYTHAKPTLMITCRGATCGTVNLSEPFSYIMGNAMALDNLDKERAHLKYLYYFLTWQGFDQVISGTAQPQITRTGLSNYEVLLPPLGEQRRIAAVLDKADALRQKRRAALARLDTLLQATFLHMFGDPVTNPMGWEEMELFDTADKFSDGPFGSNLKTEHYTESGIQVIRLQNIGVGYLDESDKAFISEEHYQSLPRHHCIPGDIVVGTLGDPNLRATIIPQHIDRCLNKADCVQYRVNSKIMNKDYACWLLNNPNIIKRASALSLGQTRLRISMGRLKGLIVPVPPLEKQKTFSVYYQRFAIEKNAQVENLGLLDNLFHALQQRAFSGQL